jgi:tRNA (uracil-5-)-methyltransferase
LLIWQVLKALRACLPLRRLVYVACHAPSFVQNAVALCRPSSRSFAGEPFAPVSAHAVDLFPHTAKCELVVVLERPGLVAGAAESAELTAAESSAEPARGKEEESKEEESKGVLESGESK